MLRNLTSMSHLLWSHVRGGPFAHGSLNQVLGIIVIFSSDQTKVCNLHLSTLSKQDVGRLTEESHTAIDDVASWLMGYNKWFYPLPLTFRSLWMNFLECRCSTPLINCRAMARLSRLLFPLRDFFFSFFSSIHTLRVLVSHSSNWI